MVVGQFGVTNTVLNFAVKWIVAWTIQFTGSIALAMMIPTAMLLATGFFTSAQPGEYEKELAQPDPSVLPASAACTSKIRYLSIAS